jgi:hypothetical protein
VTDRRRRGRTGFDRGDDAAVNRLSRRLFDTTNTLDSAMAPPAILLIVARHIDGMDGDRLADLRGRACTCWT